MSLSGATTFEDRPVLLPRLPSLTSLRFFAAALVVAVHVGEVFPGAGALQHGQVGVSFFYLLSGFILTWTPSPNDTPQAFYRRRFARIVPVHLLTWIVAVFVLAPVADRGRSVVGVLLSLVLLQAWVPDDTIAFAANGVSWSLSVEVFFYALFPLLMPRITRLTVRSLIVLALSMVVLTVVISALAPVDALIYIFPISRLPEFVIGICMSALASRGMKAPLRLAFAAPLAVGATVLVYLPVIPDRWTFEALTVVPYALLIWSMCDADRFGRPALRWAPLIALGDWSYSLFMTHQIVIRFFDAGITDPMWRAILIVPLLLLCVVIAWATFRWVERPLERLLRKPRPRATP